ncbi:MAG: hypothetical protein ACI8PZ_000354 [Myxococcota bacterium]|jgi:uncharacterized protein YqeY
MCSEVHVSIYDSLNVELKASMRARDKARTTGLRNIRAAFISAQKADGSDSLSDEQCIGILRRLSKQRRESIDAYTSAGRDDLVGPEQEELEVIEAFLPKLADEATTRGWVEEAVAATGASSVRDLGKVMGHLMRHHKADIDAGLASTIVRGMLTA